MKYLGAKSLSSFLSWFFRIGWYVALVFAVLAGLVGMYLLFVPLNDPTLAAIAKSVNGNLQDKDWVTFKNLPLVVRILFVPYFVAVVMFMLKLMEKAQHLFTNFKNSIVFDKNNVRIIATISKLMIVFSILTFDFSSLLISIFLLMLCEIFKNGTALQEEHDLTV